MCLVSRQAIKSFRGVGTSEFGVGFHAVTHGVFLFFVIWSQLYWKVKIKKDDILWLFVYDFTVHEEIPRTVAY